MTRRSNWVEERQENRARAVELCPHVDNPVGTADEAVVDALYLVDAVRQLDPREVWGLLAMWRNEDPIRLYAVTVALAAMVPADSSVSDLLGVDRRACLVGGECGVSKIVPFDAPSRGELWERLRVVESILNQRTIVPESTRRDLLRAVRGELVAVPEPGEAG